MDSSLFLKTPPPLDPAWLAHEKAANLLAPQPIIDSASERQASYSQRCKNLNSELLGGRDMHLASGLTIHDFLVPGDAKGSSSVPVRSYIPALASAEAGSEGGTGPLVIYYHGGGLYVGDLDSEDMTCRRICKGLQCTVYSVDYRLMPQHSADDSLADAVEAFKQLATHRRPSRLVLAGSSSGAQLAAQVSQICGEKIKIGGVLLRGPVTCDATEGGANLPPKWKGKHFSMSKPFYTSLLSNAAVSASNRTTSPMPLEAEDRIISKQPRHWIQVCTNDIYYSDGVCYAAALKEAGVEVKLDVVEGWPHTFVREIFPLKHPIREGDTSLKIHWVL